MFVKGYTKEGFKGQVFHVHLRYEGEWDEMLFRDYLREHSEAAVEYEKLKVALAQTFRHDRDGYTEAKSEFIQTVVMIAGKLM